MPNPSKGARLWLRPAAGDRKATWIIRDGAKSSRTGCGAQDRGGAEKALRDYLASKYQPPTTERSPVATAVADVLAVYLLDRGRYVARPAALSQRVGFLLDFWGTDKLDAVPRRCQEYIQTRGEQPARRELEDLRAAINHYRKKRGLLDREVRVDLPPKAAPRERWLTRNEAALLLNLARKHPQRRHVARFILVGLYTGTRAGAICTASVRPAPSRGYVDLARGVFYRLPRGKRQTNKRQPTIRIPPRLLAHMRRWPCANAVVEYEGRAVASVKKAFSTLVQMAGLEGVTQHTLRHTAITWAMQNGADIYHAAGYFGVSPKIITEVYGHHHPDYQDEIGEAVTARPAQVRRRFTRTNVEGQPRT